MKARAYQSQNIFVGGHVFFLWSISKTWSLNSLSFHLPLFSCTCTQSYVYVCTQIYSHSLITKLWGSESVWLYLLSLQQLFQISSSNDQGRRYHLISALILQNSRPIKAWQSTAKTTAGFSLKMKRRWSKR